MHQAREDSKILAALVPKLASFAHADRSNGAISAATAQGRSCASAALWAVAEHAHKNDELARQLFDLRWAIACGVLGIPCDRGSLRLPQPSVPE